MRRGALHLAISAPNLANHMSLLFLSSLRDPLTAAVTDEYVPSHLSLDSLPVWMPKLSLELLRKQF
jgi:hypothetical protein